MEKESFVFLALIVAMLFAAVFIAILLISKKRNEEKEKNLEEAAIIYKKILKSIYFQFYEYETGTNHYAYSLGITNIDIGMDENFKVIKEPLTIEITLRNPGIIIGKAGATIDEIKENISKETHIESSQINIHLKEYDIFKQIFS